MLQDPRKAMPDIDEQLLGEPSGFFAAWFKTHPELEPLPAAVATGAPVLLPPSAPGVSSTAPEVSEQPLTASADDDQAPWARETRRRRTFDSKAPLGPWGSRDSEVAGGLVASPSVDSTPALSYEAAAAAYEAAQRLKPVAVVQPVVELLDSDDDAPPPVQPAPSLAAAAAPPSRSVEAVTPAAAIEKTALAPDVVVDIDDDSDNEALPAQTSIGSAETAAQPSDGDPVPMEVEPEQNLPELLEQIRRLEEVTKQKQHEAAERETMEEVSMLDAEPAEGSMLDVDPYSMDTGEIPATGDAAEGSMMDDGCSLLDDVVAPAAAEIAASDGQHVATETGVESSSGEDSSGSDSSDEDAGIDSLFAVAAKACQDANSPGTEPAAS